MAFGTVSGTFQGNNASIPASFAAALSTGSGVVNIGDVVVVLVTEQTALTVTSVTDSQANTYTAQNAGTLSGANVSGRLFWTRIVTAGTLTSITATCTASADDGVIVAAIINGPFLASPVDVNLANASDIVSPFTAPPTGTMAQTTEVVVSWGASTGSAAWTGTAPTVIAIQQASAAVVEGILGTQVPPSTATVTPTYTGTAPTADVLGTISFKGDIAAIDTAYSQSLSLPSGRMNAKVLATSAVAVMVSGLFSPVIRPILPNIGWFSSLSEPVRRITQAARLADDGVFAAPENFPSCGLAVIDTIGTVLVGGSSVNTLNYTGITVGGGANRALVAMVQSDNNTTGMAAVWDQGGTNQTMTLIGTTTNIAQTTAIFGLRNPISGNKTLRFSWTTAGFPTATAVSLITVDQSSDANAFKNYQSNTGNVSSLSVTVPSRPGDIVVGIGCAAGPTVTAVGTNSLYIDNTSVGNHSGAGWNAGATSVTFTGTGGAPGNWVLSAIDVAALPCSIELNRWLVPLSEPVCRVRAAQKVNLFPFTATAAAATVTVDEWFTSFTNPVRIKPQLAAALQQPVAFVPVVAPVVSIDWLTPMSIPVRVRTSPANQQALAFAFNPILITGWSAPLSEPSRRKQQAITDYAYAPLAISEVVTIDKWFNPLAPPLRAKLSPSSQQAYFAASFIDQNAIPLTTRFSPLTDPTRARPRPTESPSLFFVAQVAVAVPTQSWFAPLADPVRRIPAAQKVNLFPFTAAAVVTPETVTVDKWFVSFTDPVRIKPQLATGLQQSLAFVQAAPFAETVTESRWHQPWSEPVRVKAGLKSATQTAFFAPSTIVAGETITVDKWFAHLSGPVRQRIRTVKATVSGFTASVTPEDITPDKWFVPLGEPVRQKAGLPTSEQQALAFVATVTATTDIRWFAPFSEPVKTKASLPAASQQALAFVKAAPFAESVTEDRWHQPWSNPANPKRGLSTANQQALAFVAVVIAAPAPAESWFAPLSDPTRRIAAAQKVNLFPFTASAIVTPETVTVDKWFVSFTDPVRKPGLSTASQTAFFAPSRVITTEIITVDKWFESFADVIRRKPEERDHYKGENEFTAIAASMKWFAPLNVPVRQRIGLSVTQQPTLAFVATVSETITVDKWFAPLADPVRVKPALLTGRQQFLTWPTQIIIPSLASWWRPLNDPPKAKTSLAAANQRFEFRTADFIPHPDRFLEGWYNWWSEPVRSKLGLAARFQSSWIGPHRVISTTVTLSMSATETGVDVAMFAITVLPYNPPASAVVSLKEIGTGASLTSIVEIGDDGSLTSVVES